MSIPQSSTGPWVVLNAPVTAVLGRYDTEGLARAAADEFGSASFPHLLTDVERAALDTLSTEPDEDDEDDMLHVSTSGSAITPVRVVGRCSTEGSPIVDFDTACELVTAWADALGVDEHRGWVMSDDEEDSASFFLARIAPGSTERISIEQWQPFWEPSFDQASGTNAYALKDFPHEVTERSREEAQRAALRAEALTDAAGAVFDTALPAESARFLEERAASEAAGTAD